MATSIAKTIAAKMEHEVSNNMMMTTEGSDLRPSSTVESDMVTREQIADLSERTLEATEMGRNNVDGDSNSPSTMDMIDSVVPVSPPGKCNMSCVCMMALSLVFRCLLEHISREFFVCVCVFYLPAQV